MSTEATPQGAVRKTLKFFAPLLALLIGMFIATGLAWWLSAPRELVLFLLFGTIGLLTVGPYVWVIIRHFALAGKIPLFWTSKENPGEIHLSRFSPSAWQRAVCKVDEPVQKSTYSGPAFVGLDLQREQIEVPGQTEPVERWTFEGTWRASLDWWEFEVMDSALVSTWDKIVPKAKRAAQAEGAAAGEALDMGLDQVADIMTGVENDVMYSNAADNLGSLLDLDGLEDAEANRELFDSGESDREPDEAVHDAAQEATAPDGGEPDA